MNKIILASHGLLSAGMKDTVSMILGELPNVYAVATTRDETESVATAAKRLLESFDSNDHVFILTDVMGGSVNNEMLSLLAEYPDLNVICGMNLSLVLNLALLTDTLAKDEVQNIIEQSKEQIIYCSSILENNEEEEDLL